MNKFVLLASLATLALTTVSAEARDRWRYRHVQPWEDQPVYAYDDESDDDVAYYEEDDSDDDDVVVIPRRYQQPRHASRRAQMRAAEEAVERELWWLENGAKSKLDKRNAARQQSFKKPVVKKAVAKPLASVKPVTATKPKLVASAKLPAPKPKAVVAQKSDKLQTASLSKPAAVAKPKVVTAKTIGCTAGAAVVTGYGFAEVKPKTCTGESYAYTAIRAGKTYEIKLAASSGEITDVKKLN